jgi:hypothetical protein
MNASSLHDRWAAGDATEGRSGTGHAGANHMFAIGHQRAGARKSAAMKTRRNRRRDACDAMK